jgi:hypothetical protein
MIVALLHHPLAALRRMDLPFFLFWSSYLAVWPGILYWWSRI